MKRPAPTHSECLDILIERAKLESISLSQMSPSVPDDIYFKRQEEVNKALSMAAEYANDLRSLGIRGKECVRLCDCWIINHKYFD